MFVFDHGVEVVLIGVFVLVLYDGPSIVLLVVHILDHHTVEVFVDRIVFLHLLIVPVSVFTGFHHPVSFNFRQ
jgi:hypothetical protein